MVEEMMEDMIFVFIAQLIFSHTMIIRVLNTLNFDEENTSSFARIWTLKSIVATRIRDTIPEYPV